MASQALATEPLDAQFAFFREAMFQGHCAVTGVRGAWHPHHVIAQQHLRKLGLPRYDRRNALRLSPEAHADHTNAVRKIRTGELRRCNIEYAVEAMGAERGVEYLRRYYDDARPDSRLEALCPAR